MAHVPVATNTMKGMDHACRSVVGIKDEQRVTSGWFK
uniref:Uncharacterized protein n=1 Tax=Arundo donax TaxID=35708 RepID=A0A0A8YGI6_ARUDO